LFELEDYNFDIEQVLNIGSQSSGAGAGKITFNPFSITGQIDIASPLLFQDVCTGEPIKNVGLGLRKSTGSKSSGVFFLAFTILAAPTRIFGNFQFLLDVVKRFAMSHQRPDTVHEQRDVESIAPGDHQEADNPQIKIIAKNSGDTPAKSFLWNATIQYIVAPSQKRERDLLEITKQTNLVGARIPAANHMPVHERILFSNVSRGGVKGRLP
jgi:hypothetical protein